MLLILETNFGQYAECRTHTHMHNFLSPLLLAGIVDDLAAAGVPCFGPSAKAAQLEASKSFSKSFMDRQGIPTARWSSFTDPQEACRYIRG